MIRIGLSTSFLSLLAFTLSTAIAAPVTGVTATTSMGACCGTSIGNLVDGSGLSSYDESAGADSGTTNWIGQSKTGDIDFNLNGLYYLGGIAVWNTSFGVSQYSIAVSTNGVDYIPVSGFPVGLANVASGVTTFAEVQNFSPLYATNVRMSLLSGYSVSNNTGLKEVMFLTAAVPEPGSIALLALPLAAIFAATLRRKRALAQVHAPDFSGPTHAELLH